MLPYFQPLLHKVFIKAPYPARTSSTQAIRQRLPTRLEKMSHWSSHDTCVSSVKFPESIIP